MAVPPVAVPSRIPSGTPGGVLPATLLPGLILWPAVVGVAFSLLIRYSNLDLNLSTRIWDAGEASWPGRSTGWASFLYDYGPWPALALGLGGIAVFLAGLVRRRPQPVPGLFLFLSLAVGPGLVVNAIFKDHFGRPRPAEITSFGGDATFLPVGTPGITGQGKSFPSGHASLGFFPGVPAFPFPGLFVYSSAFLCAIATSALRITSGGYRTQRRGSYSRLPSRP